MLGEERPNGCAKGGCGRDLSGKGYLSGRTKSIRLVQFAEGTHPRTPTLHLIARGFRLIGSGKMDGLGRTTFRGRRILHQFREAQAEALLRQGGGGALRGDDPGAEGGGLGVVFGGNAGRRGYEEGLKSCWEVEGVGLVFGRCCFVLSCYNFLACFSIVSSR